MSVHLFYTCDLGWAMGNRQRPPSVFLAQFVNSWPLSRCDYLEMIKIFYEFRLQAVLQRYWRPWDNVEEDQIIYIYKLCFILSLMFIQLVCKVYKSSIHCAMLVISFLFFTFSVQIYWTHLDPFYLINNNIKHRIRIQNETIMSRFFNPVVTNFLVFH